MSEPLTLERTEEDSVTYAKGFEHAVRNILAAITKQHDTEGNKDVQLGLSIAQRIAASYQGWMSPK